MTQPVKILSAPGIKRDGTRLEGESYVDGQWCRFQRGRPRKMGGFQAVADEVTEAARGMSSFSEDGSNFLHVGGATVLGQFIVNSSGSFTGVNGRTPAALVDSTDNLWQFDVFFDQVNVVNRLIAHAAPNLSNIDSSTETVVWVGDVSATAILTSTGRSVSGGVTALGPYLFTFGNDGQIGYSAVNDPAGIYTDAFVTPQKVIKGLPIRGAGQGPAGLFWSLDSLIRATFVGGAAVWRFDTVTSETSILSSQGVIEYDGIFYWMGVDRMLMFNGVVRDVPNHMNINYFFDNVNFAQRQKVFAYKVPRFGEIWWCYPRGDATECTHAIVYNVVEQTWYDTQLPDEGRSAGIYAKVYRKPFMIDNTSTAQGFTIWQHETGTDRIEASDVQPIQSYFETAEMTMLAAEESSDSALRVARIEPDFVQTGNMTVSVKGRVNARAPIVEGEIFTFNDLATTGDEETVKVRDVRRLMSFKFESNVAGGDYEMGECYAHIEPADGRIES